MLMIKVYEKMFFCSTENISDINELVNFDFLFNYDYFDHRNISGRKYSLAELSIRSKFHKKSRYEGQFFEIVHLIMI